MPEQPKQPGGCVSYLGPQGSYSSLAAKALARGTGAALRQFLRRG